MSSTAGQTMASRAAGRYTVRSDRTRRETARDGTRASPCAIRQASDQNRASRRQLRTAGRRLAEVPDCLQALAVFC